MSVLRTLFGLLFAVALAVGLYFGYSAYIAPDGAGGTAGRQGGRGFGGNTQAVIAMPVRQEVFVDRLEAIGTLQANESIFVTARVQGIVKSINFRDGETVEAGTALVQFDQDEESARLQVELANLEEQRKQFERITGLARANATSEARFDEQQAAVKKAEANVNAARARLDDYTIRAPFAGRLGTRRISTGALVSPNTTITTLDDLSMVKLDFSIPETYLSTVREGLDIEATTAAYPDEIFNGLVTSIDTRINPTTRSVDIRAEILNEDRRLRPGMLMVVDLIKDRRESLMIAEESLVPFDNQQFVFVVSDDNTVERVPVTIGRRRPGSVEILEGLAMGDLVITEGNTSLSSGNKVRLLNEADVRDGPVSAATRPSQG
ncbi:MAG: efflux RND transporter periplasmic adaptor subunit [Rhodospirillaceae bacterium]|jgi:membrane fusion protein, multidrug efflux system|nr:efflux RND transporter periplasmic adaptor subunit [Rhodospirillaceae bacterium]MBT5240123.1 efflux RND transporter periplasmic adaptor subunit [Rhodospirillaceae bacterium]MBT5566902.1 efflux RND transporter periplasmic adaptor subunit [Rhodospirillaceae bacterium]MBT6090411.1 efflux RND transporter periplasmic adaptor subunit [Rhodospirillaceae bacterium]MBT6960618.1 efflux RND transporter periplasmic adaptor subunit [Rhodospirillaceae bacterium]